MMSPESVPSALPPPVEEEVCSGDSENEEEVWSGPSNKECGEIDTTEDGKEATNNCEDRVEEPKVGITFDTSDEVYLYYSRYAKEKGFAVSKRTSRKGRDGKMKDATISCSRAGKARRPRVTTSNPVKLRPQSKIDCPAHITIVILPDGKWRLNRVVLEHNHEQNPGNVRFFKSNRVLDEHVKRKLELNDTVGSKLNDGGANIRVNFKRYQAEIERQRLKRLEKVDDGYKKLTESKGPCSTSASDGVTQEAPSYHPASHSVFTTHFSENLEGKNTNSRTVNAFESDLSVLGLCGCGKIKYKGKFSPKEQPTTTISSRQLPFHFPTNLSVDVVERVNLNCHQNGAHFSIGSPCILEEKVESKDAPFEAKFEAFMAKLNEDDNVDAQFPEFGAPTVGTRETVGGYLLPKASSDFLEKLVSKYGDFTTGVKRSRFSTLALSNLCAAVWDMSLIALDDLNETLILKWKTAAIDAESLGFDVTFFKAYLQTLVKALFGRVARVVTAPRLEKINTRIDVLKAELEMLEREKQSLLAKPSVGVEGECMSIAATFEGCPLSEQLLKM